MDGERVGRRIALRYPASVWTKEFHAERRGRHGHVQRLGASCPERTPGSRDGADLRRKAVRLAAHHQDRRPAQGQLMDRRPDMSAR